MDPRNNRLWKKQKYLVKKYYKQIEFERLSEDDSFIENNEELIKIGKEILNIIVKYTQIKKLYFIDICGAPGNYSKLLLKEYKNSKGIGISLPIEMGGVPFEIEDNNYKIFYKDILNKTYKLKLDKKVNLGIASCVSYTKDSKNAFRINLQLIFKSMLIILKNLETNGSMVINLTMKNIFFAFNIINLLNNLFNTIAIWKSKNVWADKNTFYFFGFGYNKKEDIINKIKNIQNILKNKYFIKNDLFNKIIMSDKKYYIIEKHMESIYLVKINHFN